MNVGDKVITKTDGIIGEIISVEVHPRTGNVQRIEVRSDATGATFRTPPNRLQMKERS